MSLFEYNTPVAEFIRWFNLNFNTPPVAVKYTALDGNRSSHFDGLSWIIWIDIRVPYQDIVDLIGHEVARCVSIQNGVDLLETYSEIKKQWAVYVTSSASSKEQIVRRKLP